MANASCTIAINEVDGVLSISAEIPDNADHTIAAAITKAMLESGRAMMNRVLHDDQQIQRASTN
jgi:predicted regulator of Ras-like GTPase activity (Roadblock/LC7/MglB family)